MRPAGRRAGLLVGVWMVLALQSACANPCSDVAPSLPSPDPTACDAGVGIITCPAELYCV